MILLFRRKNSAGYKRGESKEIDNHENETRIEKKSSWKGCFSADEKIQLVFWAHSTKKTLHFFSLSFSSSFYFEAISIPCLQTQFTPFADPPPPLSFLSGNEWAVCGQHFWPSLTLSWSSLSFIDDKYAPLFFPSLSHSHSHLLLLSQLSPTSVGSPSLTITSPNCIIAVTEASFEPMVQPRQC